MIKRNNHYVSAFYLAGFTASGDRDDFLYVHDLMQRKTWRSKPKNVGWQKDYYRNPLKGGSPNEIEDGIEKYIETPAAEVVRQIISNKALPDNNSQSFRSLMAFLIQMAVGVPLIRESLAFEQQQRIKTHLKRVIEESPAFWESTLKEIQSAGIDLPANLDSDIAKDTDDYSIGFSQKWHIYNLFDYFISITEQAHLLTERTWSLIIVKEGAGHLVCSDVPVSCIPLGSYGETASQRYVRPDFAEDTIIYMPLTHSLAIEGAFRNLRPQRYIDSENIAVANSFTIRTAMLEEHRLRYVYSPYQDFTCWGIDSVVDSDEIKSGRLEQKVLDAMLEHQQNSILNG
jgi:uncharacterized protein DUF4238